MRPIFMLCLLIHAVGGGASNTSLRGGSKTDSTEATASRRSVSNPKTVEHKLGQDN